MEIAWTLEMSVGEEKIDEQHKRLLSVLNELGEVLEAPLDMAPLRKLIDFFGKYAKEHLAYEEEYMAKNNYPELDEHKKLHQEFTDYFGEFRKKFYDTYNSPGFSDRDIRNLLEEAHKFLSGWWVTHILEEDKKYAEYIETQGE